MSFPNGGPAGGAVGTLAVSILVLVDVLPERWRDIGYHFGIEVSILVLVDVLPEHSHRQTWLINSKCFNPCFSGCPSRTFERNGEMDYSSPVSILVLVDVLPEQDMRRKQPSAPLWFQSLF